MTYENKGRWEDRMRLVLHDNFVALASPDLMRLIFDAGEGVVEHSDKQIDEQNICEKKIQRVEHWNNPGS
jgi:hypothetical protein